MWSRDTACGWAACSKSRGASLLLHQRAAKTPAAVIRELERMPEVEEVSSVSGPYDYLIFLRCETHEQLDALLDRIGLIDGVKQTQTSIVLSRKVDRRSAVAAP